MSQTANTQPTEDTQEVQNVLKPTRERIQKAKQYVGTWAETT